MDTLQGSGISRLLQVTRKAGRNDFDRFELATVVDAYPNPVTIKIDNCPIVFGAGDLVIAEHLTQYTRQVTINGGTLSDMVVNSPLQVGDRVITVSMNGGQSYVVIDKAVIL